MRVRTLFIISCFFVWPLFADKVSKEEFNLSTPEQIAALTGDSQYLIGGVISPLSGQPVLTQTDLIVRGAQEIVLNRIYIPPNIPSSFNKHKKNQNEWHQFELCDYVTTHYKGWKFLSHVYLIAAPALMQFRVTEPNGLTLYFKLSGPGNSITTYTGPLQGINNIAGSTPSGKSDPRNTRISYDDSKITVYSSDGTVRIYRWKIKDGFYDHVYLLEKEYLPSGKLLRYQYINNHPYLIESCDPQERFVYATLRIDGSPWDKECKFTSSTGQIAHHNYYQRRIPTNIKENGVRQKNLFICPPMLGAVSSPFYRAESSDYNDYFLLSHFSGQADIFRCEYQSIGNLYRVDKLLFPVGLNDNYVPVHQISYQPAVAGEKAGITTVNNSDGTSMIYHFSKDFLLTLIQYFGANGQLEKEKSIQWFDNQWMKTIQWKDHRTGSFHQRTYEYDRYGNPILETLTGNLTGDNPNEILTTKRTFSEDGRNLLLREETEDGKVIALFYHANTNLLSKKLTKDIDKVILREFFAYDDCNNLILTISDDGSGEDSDDLSHVSQRTIKKYTLRQSAPFLHMPEWIEETYLENGTEKPLKKTRFIYDNQGNIAEEEIYDAQGKYAYTIYKTYNERGDVLTVTNRLAQQAISTYDLRGRPKTGINFSNRIEKIFRYDTKGRLREITEKGDDGISRTISSEYDFQDRRIQKRDHFQNVTNYTYDLLVGEIRKTDFPPIASLEKQTTPVTTTTSHDSFGRKLTQTDANGYTTTYCYNVYGNPTEIIHPNGGREIFRYTKNGQLSFHTDLDNLTTHYQRDILGRILAKTYMTSDGNTYAQQTFTYNGFNLLSETNKEGHVRIYSYDGSGRKIREEYLTQVTDYEYNPLGWLSKTIKWNGDNTLITLYERDLEGRILEESRATPTGSLLYKISYTYDDDGNQETITRIINEQEAVETFTYDSFGRQKKHQDALGNIWETTYSENHTNEIGQKVLKTTNFDPQGTQTIEISDAYHRLARKEIVQGAKILSCKEITYDPHGNQLFQKDYVYENGIYKNTQIAAYAYTSMHQLATSTRAFGTDLARTTAYTYFLGGKVKTKTHPSGTTLFYTYNPLGDIEQVRSSDNTIHHRFAHNLEGDLIEAFDEINHTHFTRVVDPFGNILQEDLSTGIQLIKDYDAFNRLTYLKMGQWGEVIYTYDPMYLRSVERYSSHSNPLYEHTYDHYDPSGHLISESPIGKIGQTYHKTTPLRQKALITNPHFSEEYLYDVIGNLEHKIMHDCEHHYTYDSLSQITSEDQITYCHDSLYNRTHQNGLPSPTNDLNELITLSYDENGNQKHLGTYTLHYDALNRLTQAISDTQKINILYDPLGRRLTKTVHDKTYFGWKESLHEHYLYHGSHEIGAKTVDNKLLNLRVLGLGHDQKIPKTISIEIQEQILAPLLDCQNNIRALVDIHRQHMTPLSYTAFGEELSSPSNSPWGFASKRYDPELGIINFGKRYYIPTLGRWLTTDPLGTIDSINLYQYNFNNPFRYYDPEGESLLGFICGIGQMIAGAALVVTGTVIEVATFGGWTVGFTLQAQAGLALMTTGFTQALYNSKDLSHNGRWNDGLGNSFSWKNPFSSSEVQKQKNTDVYAPDRPLPLTENGIPIPETDAPHTELGTRDGSKGKYPQAREFDGDGKPVRDIDFTDHGYPNNHPNPHQHRPAQNPTGGTPQRGKPEPLPEWRY